MKDQYLNRRIEALLKIPSALAAILVASLLCHACGSSGLQTGAGGSGGGIGSGGTTGADADVSSSASDSDASDSYELGETGGQTGTPPRCSSIRLCDPGDQQVDGSCPAGRECYSFQQYCFSATTVCMLPEGVRCIDLSCNPGDTRTASDDQDCRAHPNACYAKQLCGQPIMCRYGADAAVDAPLRDAATDDGATGAGEAQDAVPRCGDGIVQVDLGEQCDLGDQNNVFQSNMGICTVYCQWIPWLP